MFDGFPRIGEVAAMATAVSWSFTALFFAAAAPQEPEMPKPGKEHDLLKHFVGEWDAAGKFTQDANGPAVEMKGTETSRIGLGGFFLLTDFKADFMGKPFEGRWTMTYSIFKKKYVASWTDSMLPHIYTAEGDYDEAKKSFTMIAEGFDLNTGKPSKERWVMEIQGTDAHTMTFYGPGPDGKERKTGEIAYKKKK